MKRTTYLNLLSALAAMGLATPAFAQSTVSSLQMSDHVLESYVAYIGPYDLLNSSGIRLSQPWQIIRQDRANFHRFGRGDDLDEWDSYFASKVNRSQMEHMLRQGWIEPQAAWDIVNGGALVLVQIYGRGSTGNAIRVSVAR